MIKPDNKKVSTQFLNYLKATSSMPQNKPQSFKEKQPTIDNCQKHHTYHGPVEGDFSKIGLTYVLENDQLKKKDAIYRKPNLIQVHNQKYEEPEEPTDVELIKEMTKLQFLQKKGYLKPEQTQRLQALRGMKFTPELQEAVQIPEKKMKNPEGRQIQPQMIPFEIDSENMDPNTYYQDPYICQKTKFGEPVYNHPQFSQPMHYNQPMNYAQKPQYFNQGHSMNYGPAMQPPQFDHRQTGYY